MTIAQFGLNVSILTARMTGFLLHLFNAINEIGKARCGLPAGGVLVSAARLVLATTCCSKPLFRSEMLKAAAFYGHDVVLMRHGMEPEETCVTVFDVVIHVNDYPCLITDLVLYLDLNGRYFLVPSGNGAHIALESDGLRLLDEPPFITWHERCDAVCRAAREIKRAARPVNGRRPAGGC